MLKSFLCKKFIIEMILIALVSYNVYCIFLAENGLISGYKLQKDLINNMQNSKTISLNISHMEHKISDIHNGQNPEEIEAMARRILGYSYNQESIINNKL